MSANLYERFAQQRKEREELARLPQYLQNLKARRTELSRLPQLLQDAQAEAKRRRELEAAASTCRVEYAAEISSLKSFLATAPFNADLDEVSQARIKLETLTLLQARIPTENAVLLSDNTNYDGAEQTCARLSQFAESLERRRQTLLGEIPIWQAKLDAPAVIKNPYQWDSSLSPTDNAPRAAAALLQAREAHYGPLREKLAELQAELNETEFFLSDYCKVIAEVRAQERKELEAMVRG